MLVLSSHGEIKTDETGVILERVFYCPDDGSCDCRGDWASYESIVPNEGSVHDGEVDILNCQITHNDGTVEPAIDWEA